MQLKAWFCGSSLLSLPSKSLGFLQRRGETMAGLHDWVRWQTSPRDYTRRRKVKAQKQWSGIHFKVLAWSLKENFLGRSTPWNEKIFCNVNQELLLEILTKCWGIHYQKGKTESHNSSFWAKQELSCSPCPDRVNIRARALHHGFRTSHNPSGRPYCSSGGLVTNAACYAPGVTL